MDFRLRFRSFNEVLDGDGKAVLANASVQLMFGYALYLPELNSAADLLRTADQRMYEDKMKGRLAPLARGRPSSGLVRPALTASESLIYAGQCRSDQVPR